MLRLVMLLGLVAIVTLLVAPSAISTLDRLARDHEEAALQSLMGGLKASIVRQRAIPEADGVADALAGELGMSAVAVERNARSFHRVFVLHPQIEAVLRPPWRQDWQGVPNLDRDRMRVMMVSCLSHDLPEEMRDAARLSEAEFDALWDAPASAYPPNWQSERAWHDFQIERLNLADLFVEVRMRGLGAAGPGRARFVLEEGGVPASAVLAAEFRSHYLKGSVLRFFDDNRPEPVLSVTAVLGSAPESFVCAEGHWSRERTPGRRRVQRGASGETGRLSSTHGALPETLGRDG